MDRTEQEGHTVRLLAVIAVLLGLLAMHGLASAHHSPAAAAAPATAPGTAGQHHAPSAEGVAASHGTASHGTAHASAAVALAALPGADGIGSACTDCPAHGATALCLAVLSVGLALLARLFARRARAEGLPAPRLLLPALRAGPMPLPRPPDLVAGLCVSRT